MTKSQKTYLRYSLCFKQKVVQELSKGASISELQRRYDIKGSNTIQKWAKKFGREELLNKQIRIEMKGETDRLKALEKENARLKIALADAVLVKDALETLIEIVDEHYQTDVKKNFGQQPLTNVKSRKSAQYKRFVDISDTAVAVTTSR